ncbi:MAG: chemotaxis protein CheA [Beijerinckiaceae bacterium]|nr:chemotaxis protein CheA [Beijerinckiaceae bacterium]
MSELDPAEIFRQEASELMEQLETSLLDLEQSPQNQALIDSAFRALHTIKGSGAMFGFDRVAAFIHGFETAFDQIRKGRTQATHELIKVALDAKDHIRHLIEAPDQADAATGNRILAALDLVTNAAGHHGAPQPVTEPAPSGAPSANAKWRLGIAFDSDILVNGSNPLLMFDELRDLGQCDLVAEWENIPPLEDLNPQQMYLTWHGQLTMPHPIEVLQDVFMFVLDDMRLDVERIAASDEDAAIQTPVLAAPDHPALNKPETQTEAPQASEAAPALRAAAKETATIRVPAERLDEMMDRVGELVIAQARLTQLVTGKDEAIKSVAEDIARLTSGLREAVMGIRMVPIGSLFVRFRRLLHDLSQDLHKEIRLVTVGDDTEMDKTMIERLADPLVHVIRNSADHGLEDTAARVAAGKSATGQITIVARHAGAEVLLSISDDGRGLDARRIRQKAEESGLIQPGAALSDSELYPLIFAPGFSTAKEVSALSGRGVGMDVVKKTIEAMRGTVDIATTPNKGTTITFHLPLTLAIIEGLLVRVADSRYVIPLTAVEECVELSETENTRSQGRSFLNIRGDLIPFLRLRELFSETGTPDVYQKVVIVSTGESRVGLVVDQIIGSHQTVIKSLSKLHADVNTFSGATILGDGAVALILDIIQIVALAQTIETRHKAAQLELASC